MLVNTVPVYYLAASKFTTLQNVRQDNQTEITFQSRDSGVNPCMAARPDKVRLNIVESLKHAAEHSGTRRMAAENKHRGVVHVEHERRWGFGKSIVVSYYLHQIRVRQYVTEIITSFVC